MANLQSAEGLVHCDWGDGADDDSLSVAPQRVLQDASELAVSVVGETPGKWSGAIERSPEQNKKVPDVHHRGH